MRSLETEEAWKLPQSVVPTLAPVRRSMLGCPFTGSRRGGNETLEFVDVRPRSLSAYRGVAPDAILDDLVRQATQLRGARVLHVNATPYGAAFRSCCGRVCPSGTTWDWSLTGRSSAATSASFRSQRTSTAVSRGGWRTDRNRAGSVFTMETFIPPDFPIAPVAIMPPAIDPVSPKNMPIDDTTARGVFEWIDVELGRPLVSQVSRFDPWKAHEIFIALLNRS